MTVAAAVQGTAIVVAMDMTGGIIDRFRTMAIARSAVLTGHVLASLIQTLLSIGIVLGVAVALGFRPDGRPTRMARRDRRPDVVLARAHLARHRPRPRRQERRNRQQHTDVPHPPSLPRQRLRARRHDADRAPPVRPTTSRSPPPPKPCADSSPEPRSAPTPSSPSPGASASPSPPTSGPDTSTHAGARPDAAVAGLGELRCSRTQVGAATHLLMSTA